PDGHSCPTPCALRAAIVRRPHRKPNAGPCFVRRPPRPPNSAALEIMGLYAFANRPVAVLVSRQPRSRSRAEGSVTENLSPGQWRAIWPPCFKTNGPASTGSEPQACLATMLRNYSQDGRFLRRPRAWGRTMPPSILSSAPHGAAPRRAANEGRRCGSEIVNAEPLVSLGSGCRGGQTLANRPARFY